MHRLGADHMVVIEDQQRFARVWLHGQLVDQGCHQALERRRRGRPQQPGHPVADPGTRPVRGHRVRQNRAGSLSPASRESHAAGCSLRRTHQRAGLSCRRRPGRRPRPAPGPGSRRDVQPGADAVPGPAVLRARGAWSPAGHPAPTRLSQMGPRAAEPSLTCTLSASGDPYRLSPFPRDVRPQTATTGQEPQPHLGIWCDAEGWPVAAARPCNAATATIHREDGMRQVPPRSSPGSGNKGGTSAASGGDAPRARPSLPSGHEPTLVTFSRRSPSER